MTADPVEPAPEESSEFSLGFMHRVDVLAATAPAYNRGVIRFGAILGVWSTVEVLVSAMRRDWVVSALFLFTAVLAGCMWWLARRAERRAPMTTQWLEARKSGPSGSHT